MKTRNARTATLKKYLDNANFRLSQDDRGFLADLARLGIIDGRDANRYHYQGRKTLGTRRLDTLCKIGLLESKTISQRGRHPFKAYQFKTDRLAVLFGGKRVALGARHSPIHDVILSKIYFAEGRPETFTTEVHFTTNQKKLFEGLAVIPNRRHCLPDALFIRDNDIVIVEADSGQYTQAQIRHKQTAWSDFQQVWGQPNIRAAKVHGAYVHTFA